jgi:hypothetical protein
MASPEGEVWSVRPDGELRPLAGCMDEDGYRLYHPHKEHHIRGHVAVLLAFRGPPPAGRVGRHLDGDRLNNTLANLQYGTTAENNRDRWAHARKTNRPQYYPARTVRAARRRLDRGESPAAVGRALGVPAKTVRRWRDRRWRDRHCRGGRDDVG